MGTWVPPFSIYRASSPGAGGVWSPARGFSAHFVGGLPDGETGPHAGGRGCCSLAEVGLAHGRGVAGTGEESARTCKPRIGRIDDPLWHHARRLRPLEYSS